MTEEKIAHKVVGIDAYYKHMQIFPIVLGLCNLIYIVFLYNILSLPDAVVSGLTEISER